jgi:hypothetical protein
VVGGVALNPHFAKAVENLHVSFDALIAMPPITTGKLPKVMPKQGVYLFSEGSRHLYVGRSNVLKQRYGQHCNPGSQHNQAVFAFKLARETTGRTKASYVPGENSRDGLSQDIDFRAAFLESKARVKRMEYRFVEECDQTKQALLELYCAIALNCPYNDFNTH